MTTIIYGLAQEVSQVYGHGDTGTEDMITRMGGYGTGEFPPFFRSKVEAAEWANKNSAFSPWKVVPLQLISKTDDEVH